MTYWLLEPSVLQQMQTAAALAAHANDAEARLQWEASRAEEDERRTKPKAAELPRGMVLAGSSAEMRIEGVLTKRPDYRAMSYGGGNTTYANIRAALDRARTEPSVKEVVFLIDSPGGTVDGFFECLDHIAAFRADSGKKFRVLGENAFSAAYGIAAAVGNIEALGPGSGFGSIGVATSAFILGPMIGKVVDLTNTESPDKRPDLSTPEGQAVVVKYLDQLSGLFFSAIARGRGVDVKTVKEDFGRGASMTAVEAKRLGLIDKIRTTAPRAAPSKGSKAMPPEDQTPESAAAAAEARGVARERDRVTAHLAMGEGCGDLSIALEAIRTGAEMTQTFQARYLTAGMNRTDRAARQSDTKAAEAALAGVGAATPATGDLGDQIAARLDVKESFVNA